MSQRLARALSIDALTHLSHLREKIERMTHECMTFKKLYITVFHREQVASLLKIKGHFPEK